MEDGLSSPSNNLFFNPHRCPDPNHPFQRVHVRVVHTHAAFGRAGAYGCVVVGAVDAYLGLAHKDLAILTTPKK